MNPNIDTKTQRVGKADQRKLAEFMNYVRENEGVVFKCDLNKWKLELARELRSRGKLIEGEEHFRMPHISGKYRT